MWRALAVVAILGGIVVAGATGDAPGERKPRADSPEPAEPVEAERREQQGAAKPQAKPKPKQKRPGKRSRRPERTAPAGTVAYVDEVIDGDTIAIHTRQKVRLVQIDTPEKFGERECYGRQASAALEALLPTGTRVALEADPALDRTDRFGRQLRYVHKGGMNVNRRLVQIGAATPWFYGGVKGRYADALEADARRARADERGLWGHCPGTRLDVWSGVDTGATASAARPSTSSKGAGGLPRAPAYPPDVDCGDLPGPVDVRGGDPHRLDRDGDGVGCG